MSEPITEEQGIAYIAELAFDEQHGARLEILIGPYSAFILIGTLQLALRHPEFSPTQAAIVNEIIDQFRPIFAGTLGETMLRLGDDPAFDIPRDCHYPFGPHSPECPPAGHKGFVPQSGLPDELTDQHGRVWTRGTETRPETPGNPG